MKTWYLVLGTKKTDKRQYPNYKYITEFNPKGLTAKQLGLKGKDYKKFCNNGICNTNK